MTDKEIINQAILYINGVNIDKFRLVKQLEDVQDRLLIRRRAIFSLTRSLNGLTGHVGGTWDAYLQDMEDIATGKTKNSRFFFPPYNF